MAQYAVVLNAGMENETVEPLFYSYDEALAYIERKYHYRVNIDIMKIVDGKLTTEF